MGERPAVDGGIGVVEDRRCLCRGSSRPSASWCWDRTSSTSASRRRWDRWHPAGWRSPGRRKRPPTDRRDRAGGFPPDRPPRPCPHRVAGSRCFWHFVGHSTTVDPGSFSSVVPPRPLAGQKQMLRHGRSGQTGSTGDTCTFPFEIVSNRLHSRGASPRFRLWLEGCIELGRGKTASTN